MTWSCDAGTDSSTATDTRTFTCYRFQRSLTDGSADDTDMRFDGDVTNGAISIFTTGDLLESFTPTTWAGATVVSACAAVLAGVSMLAF